MDVKVSRAVMSKKEWGSGRIDLPHCNWDQHHTHKRVQATFLASCGVHCVHLVCLERWGLRNPWNPCRMLDGYPLRSLESVHVVWRERTEET